MNSLKYFGTNTRSAGHYFWQFDATGQYMSSSDMWFRDIPFNPEDFTKGKNKGDVEFHKIGNWTILAVCGSPVDKRGGCKSVFFIDKDLTEEQMIQKVKMTPAAFKIVECMPFTVNHKGLSNDVLNPRQKQTDK